MITAVAVAAAVMAVTATPRAAPVLTSKACTPGSVDPRHSVVRIRRTALDDTVVVKSGDTITTEDGGLAELCLGRGHISCKVKDGSELQVLPRKSPRVLVNLRKGRLRCAAKGVAGSKLVTPGQTVTLGELGSPRTIAGVEAAAGGNLFAISVRGRQTTVKARRGATIVAQSGRRGTGVVLGRDEQVVAAKGRAPGVPTRLQLNPQENRDLDQLERTLPKDTDKNPPTGDATGPAPFSSLRSPSFRFVRNEAGTTFSCALDKSPEFRVCTDGERFPHLVPGPHSLRVKATDRAGNSQIVATYDWTIDESLIVYTSDRKSDGNTDIYVMDSDGLHQKQLTTGPAQDEDPEWSPDHRHIAFHTRRDGNLEIYVMNADGSAQTRLTNNPAPDTNPTWSPDGRRIAFESSRDLNREIYVMNADGTGVRRLTQNLADDFDPSWSPDGSQIAFASDRDGNREIYVMNADGSGITRLTNDPATDYGPSWSPDGTRIAFHSNRNATTSDIFVMESNGRGVLRLTKLSASDFNPQWAPDGQEIVFQSNRFRGDDKYDVYYVDANGGEEIRVTQIPGTHSVPDW
jgi:Tol biopolymer transport system component